MTVERYSDVKFEQIYDEAKKHEIQGMSAHGLERFLAGGAVCYDLKIRFGIQETAQHRAKEGMIVEQQQLSFCHYVFSPVRG